MAEFLPKGTPHPKGLKVSSIPLIADGEGFFTVPEEHRRKPLEVDPDFVEFGQYWKARRTPLDSLIYLIQRHVQRVPLAKRFHL